MTALPRHLRVSLAVITNFRQARGTACLNNNTSKTGGGSATTTRYSNANAAARTTLTTNLATYHPANHHQDHPPRVPIAPGQRDEEIRLPTSNPQHDQGRTSAPACKSRRKRPMEGRQGSNPEAAPQKRDRAKKARRWKGPSHECGTEWRDGREESQAPV